MKICPICGRDHPLIAEIQQEIDDLKKSGYRQNYIINITKKINNKKVILRVYRVDFANPKLKHIIEIPPRSKKTDTTRATRLKKRRNHLESVGWSISTFPINLCQD